MNLYSILTSNDIVKTINDNLDYITNLIPEIKYMIGFDHMNPAHHLDVWNHTLLALSTSEPNFDIRLTILLHDIGKPFSYQQKENIRHYKAHQDKSAEMTYSILKRLGFENEYINKICFYIKKHDTPLSDSFINDYYDEAVFIYKIQCCDAFAHNPEKLEKRIEYLEKIKEKLLNNKQYSKRIIL